MVLYKGLLKLGKRPFPLIGSSVGGRKHLRWQRRSRSPALRERQTETARWTTETGRHRQNGQMFRLNFLLVLYSRRAANIVEYIQTDSVFG